VIIFFLGPYGSYVMMDMLIGMIHFAALN